MYIMKINDLYDSAKEYINKLKAEKPNFVSDPDAAICLAVNEKNELFTGVTSFRITGGKIEAIHAEAALLMLMKSAGQMKVRQMITVQVKDNSIIQPCGECLDMLFGMDQENNSCAIVTEPDKAVSAMNIRFGTSSDANDMFSGFDFDDAPAASSSALGAPAEYAKRIVIDESNPFNASASDEEAPSEVRTFAEDQRKAAQAGENAQNNDNPASDVPVGAPVQTSQPEKAPAMSKEELLKQAKERKKMTKSNFSFWKR